MSDIPANVVVLDAGHNIIKGKTASDEVSFPHAIVELTRNQYDQIVKKAGSELSDDYLLINGRAFAVGESAEGQGVVSTRMGAERYTSDYYGVFLASVLHRLYRQTSDIALFASHPTGDVSYREDLARSAWGEWRLEHGSEKKTFCVEYVNTFEEALGGLYNIVLAESGTKYARSDVNQGRTLVIDIGGGTTDLQSVTDGKVTYDVTESIDIGIQKIEAAFEKALRDNNTSKFKNRVIDRSMIRSAIQTGVFTGGGYELSCELEVRVATNKFLNELRDVYTSKGRGPMHWHHIVLTGGGSAMLYDHLAPVLEHGHVILAEENLAALHLANVRGGMKLWKMWKAMGWL